MIYKTLTIASLLLFLLACQSKTDNTQSDNIVRNIEIKNAINSTKLNTKSEHESQKVTFDWSLTQTLKKKLIVDLQKDSNDIDKTIMQFLVEYGKIENDFNEILFDLSNYDSLNTLAYAPDNIVYESALNFKRKIESNGFSISQSEGMIYIAKNTDYIKSGVIEFLDSTSINFIQLYCKEIDSGCCDDAAIVISKESLIQRAFDWGNLLDKTTDLEYKHLTESKFLSYLSLIYLGQENTPSFDWTTAKFNNKLFELMTGIIEKYPKSKASKEFKEYTELLVKEGFKKTEKIDDYIKGLKE